MTSHQEDEDAKTVITSSSLQDAKTVITSSSLQHATIPSSSSTLQSPTHSSIAQAPKGDKGRRKVGKAGFVLGDEAAMGGLPGVDDEADDGESYLNIAENFSCA